MLILDRKLDQVVVIRDRNGDVVCRVTVVETRKGRARLGFEADRSFTVDRTEIDELKQRERAAHDAA